MEADLQKWGAAYSRGNRLWHLPKKRRNATFISGRGMMTQTLSKISQKDKILENLPFCKDWSQSLKVSSLQWRGWKDKRHRIFALSMTSGNKEIWPAISAALETRKSADISVILYLIRRSLILIFVMQQIHQMHWNPSLCVWSNAWSNPNMCARPAKMTMTWKTWWLPPNMSKVYGYQASGT